MNQITEIINDPELGDTDANTEQTIKVDKDKMYGTSKRKFKKLLLDFGILIFIFVVAIVIMEGYFILCFLLSISFLNKVILFSNEFRLVAGIMPRDTMLLVSQHLAISKDYEVIIMEQDPSDYLIYLIATLYDYQENVIDAVTKNHENHSKEYDNVFNKIVFDNMCRFVEVFLEKIDECEEFNHGILTKGMYSANIKHWDIIRQLQIDYLNSDRQDEDRHNFLNDEKVDNMIIMNEIYTVNSYDIIVVELLKNIDVFFNSEDTQNIVLFVVYITYLIITLSVFQFLFVPSIQMELWKTKSSLSILNPELIMSIPDIKKFILNNSSTVVFSNSDRE